MYCEIFFRGLEKEQEVLLTHGDSLEGVAEGFTAIAHSGSLIAGRLNHCLFSPSEAPRRSGPLTYGDSLEAS